MKSDFDLAKHQGSHRIKCSVCGRDWYDSLIGKCPERDRNVCMYCCRMCEKHYTMPGQIGQRCRAKEDARKKGKSA